MQRLLTCLLLSLFQCSFAVYASLSESHKLAAEIYETHPFTFFCETPIEDDFTVLSRNCDLCPLQNTKVKWMQIVPSRKLAQGRACYEAQICKTSTGKSFKGLTCCRATDHDFNQMEADLHNIAPEVPNLKYLNDHYSIKALQVSNTPYLCDLKVDASAKYILPPAQSRGAVARTYLYYNQKYQLPLSEEEKSLFTQWHYAYPPTPWEKERNAQIYALQGSYNPWILG